MSTSHASALDDGGLPKERYQRYHEEKARGGLALTMFGGSSMVSPDSNWGGGQINVASDEIIPDLVAFSERIHRHGAAIMCQISHLGRRADAFSTNWLPTIAPSRIRETRHRNIPREMDYTDIDRVVREYAEATWRCKEGGLDGVETVTGGHLIGQFFSPRTNRRTDAFGGSTENRARFALMVHEAIRKRVGDDFLVGIRFVVDEGIEDGIDFDECVRLARLLEGDGNIDFFNGIYGRMDTDLALAEHNMPGMSQPLTPFLREVGLFRRETKLPVFHAARIPDLASARHAIAEGLLDMVGMTRAHIADPQLVNKLVNGEEDRVRPCVGASYCMYKKVACLHNPATGREETLPQVITRATVAGPAHRGGRRRPSGPGGGARRGRARAFRGAVRSRGQTRRADAARRPCKLAARPDRHRRLARRGTAKARRCTVRLNSYADAALASWRSTPTW